MKILISTKSVNQPKDSFKQAKSQFHQPIAWLIDWSLKIVLSNTKSIEANECKVCIYAGRTWCSSSRKVTCSQILVFKSDCESDGGVQPVWEGIKMIWRKRKQLRVVKHLREDWTQFEGRFWVQLCWREICSRWEKKTPERWKIFDGGCDDDDDGSFCEEPGGGKSGGSSSSKPGRTTVSS